MIGVAAIFGIFAGTYYWFPKMFGKMMNETLGKIHFWLTFVGAYCIFVPMHFMGSPAAFGVMRTPRRGYLPRSSPFIAS